MAKKRPCPCFKIKNRKTCWRAVFEIFFALGFKCCAVGTKLKNSIKITRSLIEPHERVFVVKARATWRWNRQGPYLFSFRHHKVYAHNRHIPGTQMAHAKLRNLDFYEIFDIFMNPFDVPCVCRYFIYSRTI